MTLTNDIYLYTNDMQSQKVRKKKHIKLAAVFMGISLLLGSFLTATSAQSIRTELKSSSCTQNKQCGCDSNCSCGNYCCCNSISLK
jgi:hypothetical protein